MTEQANHPTRHGPKPGLKKQRYQKPNRDTRLQIRGLSDFPKLKGLQPTLTVVKLHHPKKHHRLIWQWLGRSALCKENQIAYQNVHGKGGILEAGEALAKVMGVRFKA